MDSESGVAPIEFDLRKHKAPGSKAAVSLNLEIENALAVVLHPSLGCPVVLESPSDTLSLFICAGEWVIDCLRADHGGVLPTGIVEGGLSLKRAINYHLKFQPWSQSSQDKARAAKDDRLLFNPAQLNESIRCHYLVNINDSCYRVDQNGDLKLFANLRESAHSQFHRYGLRHYIQIDLKGLPGLQAGELYDLAWIIRDECRREADAYRELQDEAVEAFLDRNPLIPAELKHPYKIADELTFEHDQAKRIENRHPVYVAPSDAEHLNVGHLSDVHISARQHAFKKSRAQLIPGAPADVSPYIGELCHASYPALKDLMDQFGADDDIHLLLITGDLIDYIRNYNPREFLDDPNARTGKLWSEMNLDNLLELDENGRPIRDEQGRLKPNTRKYPFSIDNVIMYSLLLYYYDTYKKPIFLTSGNHEAYSVPYGISPRADLGSSVRSTWANLGPSVLPSSKELASLSADEIIAASLRRREEEWRKRSKADYTINTNRANEGIPADHNLTITEAILMYGPDYNRVVRGGFIGADNHRNFNNSNFDWFYTVFTPLKDYYFTYRKQCFVGLEWGEDERFIDPIPSSSWSPGILPRSTRSINNGQLALLRGLQAKETDCIVLFAHFTFANYDPAVPINEEGAIYIGERATAYSKHNVGTFEVSRTTIYREFIGEGKLHYTLSGHSHRAGLYQVTEVRNGLLEKEKLLLAAAAPSVSGAYRGTNGNNTKMIVSACGGPISVQNHEGEFAGMGLDYPAGSYVKFSGSPRVGVVRSKSVPTAKPRLAVALDYADLIGKKGPVFRKFHSSANLASFTVAINESLGFSSTTISGISIHLQDGNQFVEVEFDVTHAGNNTIQARASRCTPSNLSPDDVLMEVAGDSEKSRLMFAAIRFDAGRPVPSHLSAYNLRDSWIFPASIRTRADEIMELYQELSKSNPNIQDDPIMRAHWEATANSTPGLSVRRHTKYGEVPDFEAWQDLDPTEFRFNRKTS